MGKLGLFLYFFVRLSVNPTLFYVMPFRKFFLHHFFIKPTPKQFIARIMGLDYSLARMKHPIKYDLYDANKSYEENYSDGPFFSGPKAERPEVKHKIKLWNWELNSPIGIPAGPLLNSNWIKFYAQMGFDIPVYKTVRSVAHPSHPAPNCVYVNPAQQIQLGEKPQLITVPKPEFLEELTITNSFGVPSKPSQTWMEDVKIANESLGDGQIMILSFMGTDGAGGRDLIADYAFTAAMAVDAGGKILETNYSCPNLCGGKAGAIYQDPDSSSQISKAIRNEIGSSTPFMIKIGNLPYEQLKEVVKANLPFVDGIAGINTMPGEVRNPDGTQALPGEGRLSSGICGSKIKAVSQDFVEKLVQIKKELNGDFVICGVGGIMTAEDFTERLNAGADIAMSATAIMWDPYLAQRYHESMI